MNFKSAISMSVLMRISANVSESQHNGALLSIWHRQLTAGAPYVL
jgi:hypothetical protein